MDWNRVEVVLNFSLEKFVNIEIYDFRFSTVPNSWPDLFQYNFSSFLFFFLFTYVCVNREMKRDHDVLTWNKKEERLVEE